MMISSQRARSVGLVGLLALVGCGIGGNSSDNGNNASSPGDDARSKGSGTATSSGSTTAPPTIKAFANAASKVCTQDVTDCAGAIQDPTRRDACMSMFAACGRYIDIIEFYRAQMIPDTQESYYLGVAYYGLFELNRSNAAKCQFGLAAKNALEEFLHEVITAPAPNGGTITSTVKLNDERTFQETYHAQSLLRNVKTIAGCQTGGATYNQIYNYAYARGRTVAEGLFLGNPPADVAPTVNSLRTTFQNTVRDVINRAADVENQLGLRQAAYDQSDARIQLIFGMLTGPDGFAFPSTALTTQPGKDVNGNDVLKPSVASLGTYQPAGAVALQVSLYGANGTTGSRLAQATAALQVIEDAMGGVDPATYENVRDKYVVPYAAQDTQWGTTLMSYEQSVDVASVRNALQSSTAALATVPDTGGYFKTIKTKMRAYYESTVGKCPAPPVAPTAPWYCQ